MSLDAIVFRGLKSLDCLVDLREVEKIDVNTGEYAYADNGRPSPPEVFVACARELANIADAAELRETFKTLLPNDSVLISQVLYDGTHCGGMLVRDDIAQLTGELDAIKVPADSVAFELVRKLRELVAASESEGNPIVFT
jgi:hypothetical protein